MVVTLVQQVSGESIHPLFKQVAFNPWPAQVPPLVTKARFVLVRGGEQAGKSLGASKFFLKKWPEDMAAFPDEQLLYWLVAEDYERTRREFGYILEDLLTIFGEAYIDATKRVDPGYIEVSLPIADSGVRKVLLRVETKSAKDPKTLAAYAPHGIIVCEASQVSYETYLKCQARVGPKRGWLYLSGTLEGSRGWYPQVAAAWELGKGDYAAFKVPSTANRTIYPGGDDDPEILRLKAATSDEFFSERIKGEIVPPRGLVFPDFNVAIHVRSDIEYVEGEPVYIWEDPGYGSLSAYAVEIAQIIGGQVRVFDEIYEQGKTTRDIIDMCRTGSYSDGKPRTWWKETKHLVSDPHYKDAHQAMSSVAEIWMKEAGLYAAGERVKILPGIERLKSFLKIDSATLKPRIVFSDRCRGILSEFGALPNPITGQYQVYTWKIDGDGQVYGETPEDRYNHGVKACIYGLVQKFGHARELASEKFKVLRFGKPIEKVPLRLRERVYAKT